MTESDRSHPGIVREFVDIITHVTPPYHEPNNVVLRRRVVVGIVLVIGAAVLGFMHSQPHSDPLFSWLALLLAVIWGAGALIAGPMHLGIVRFRGRGERPVFTGTGIGVALSVVFLLGALVVRVIPPLADQVTGILQFTTETSWRIVVLIALLNAVTEEMFFRAALYTAFGRHQPIIWSTLLYVLAVLATGNLMLGFAALVLGTVCAIERRATGGVLAPVLTHLIWGLTMVLALPPIFGM